MKNKNALNRKQLQSILGGKEMCFDIMTGECKKYGPFCGERECQIIPEIEL
ncbi:hypothetical protein [Chryseobacterium hagamense]|uniref:Bacteriocin n=1 Tax=Chryseobacterium hagamense TaxID=395935 RepID=A0A511YI06_9FLAO|nr:hypothetical protein [Chryseobacterium hagamense]GEN74834.1 hypothetical protein CHA01nite_05740 [Chryseobacterium hagamense]